MFHFYLDFIIYTVFFFFYSSRDHRDLHSFPTRRSSDLEKKSGRILMPAKYPHSSSFQFSDRSRELSLFWYGLKLLRSEEHTSELQSHSDLVCRLLLEKKKNKT